MWRSKKLIVIAVLAVVVLAGTIGGIALAQEDGEVNGDNSQPQTLLARVAAILSIDQQELEDAFAQAKSELRNEALDSYLQNLVDEGKITQEDADQYKAWWQAKPDMEPFRQQLEQWKQVEPGMPENFGLRGMPRMRSYSGHCFPLK